MPSPVGHALAGVAIVCGADIATHRRSSGRLMAAAAGLAMLPDLDLVLPGTHRTATHSLAAACLTFIVAALVTGQVTRWRTAVICGLAYASHLLLDWLGADFSPPRGIQLLWPFSGRWFISNLDVFRQTARRYFWTPPIVRQNAIAVAQEIAILLPLVIGLWLARSAARRSREHEPREHTFG